MNVFDILGPVMIGPSSSHTAGAAKIGLITGLVLGEKILKADIFLHGSFAETYKGHGTDRAIVAGLLGFSADDERIKEALNIANERGLEVLFHKTNLGDVHPNTAKLVCTGVSGKSVSLIASSIGGGDIKVINLQGLPVKFNGKLPTLIIPHQDQIGLIASVTKLLAEYGINIAQMRDTREQPGSQAMMIIETDQICNQEVVDKIKTIPGMFSVTLLKQL